MAISDLASYHRITADLLDISTALQGFAAPQALPQAVAAPQRDFFQPVPFGQQLGAAPTGPMDLQGTVNSIIQVFQRIMQQLGVAPNQAMGVGGFPQAAGAPPALPGTVPTPGAPALPAAGAPGPVAGPVAGFAPVGGFSPVPNVQGPMDQGRLLHDTGQVLIGVGQMLVQLGGGNASGMLSSPFPADGGQLKQTGASAVATSGGYEIKSLGPAEWSITDPKTGKSTRIHGDPHVSEGDGKNWDFKQDSTFVLGDGTKINVKTADAGNNTTVTDALEIISGNGQRAVMSGMKGGVGKIESVDNGPEQFRTGQTFVMGAEADDWALADKTGQGRHREIMANDKPGADTFVLGGELAMPTPPQARVNGQFAPTGPQNQLMGPVGGPLAPANALGGAPAGGGIEALLQRIQALIAGMGGQKQMGPAPMPFAPPAQALVNPFQTAQQGPPGMVMNQLLGTMAQMLTVLSQSFNLGRGLNQNKPPLAV